MIVDLSVQEGHCVLETDLCIVGGGAAGVTMAQSFAQQGIRVCLLESGGWDIEADTQRLYAGFATGHPMALEVGRYRVLGGSTSLWSGRCAKLSPIDFQKRDWIPRSGWPIGGEDLEPYYEEAASVCGFSEPWEDDDAVLRRLGADDRFHDSPIRPFLWRYAPVGDRTYRHWGTAYRDILKKASNIRVFLHANVTRLQWAPNRDRVVAVEARSLTGRRVTVKPRYVALAMGGIENARLLLHADAELPGGLGAARENIGRFFMQHASGVIGRFAPSPAVSAMLQDRYNIFVSRRGTQYETGFCLSEALQREQRLLNASVVFRYVADPSSGWEGFKTLIGRVDTSASRIRALAAIARDPASLVRNAWRRTLGHRHANYPTREVQLRIDLEQPPLAESRITLSDATDALGMRLVNVRWEFSGEERRTARIFGEHMARIAREREWGEITLEPWLYDAGPLSEHLKDTYHHLSSLRMADAPTDGVTDREGKVFGVDNLFVTGGAVFPTGGHANPTFTIVTLALRTADTLRRKLSER